MLIMGILNKTSCNLIRKSYRMNFIFEDKPNQK